MIRTQSFDNGPVEHGYICDFCLQEIARERDVVHHHEALQVRMHGQVVNVKHLCRFCEIWRLQKEAEQQK